MRQVILLTILSFTLILGSIASAEMYKWVDENGQVHYTDRPPQDLPDSAKVETVKPDSGVNVVGTRPAPPPNRPAGHVSSRDAGDDGFINNLFNTIKEKIEAVKNKDKDEDKSEDIRDHRVDLYVTSWCSYCRKAKSFLAENGVSFNEYDIEVDGEAAARKMALDGRRGVPFAVINGTKIHGWNEKAYRKALGMD